MPVPYPGPLQGGGWEMVSCLLSAVIEKTDLLTFSTRCAEFCDSPFQKMGKHTACPDMWNIPVKKTPHFWNSISKYLFLLRQNYLMNTQLCEFVFYKTVLCIQAEQPVHVLLGNCSSCIPRTSSSTLSWPCLCFLSPPDPASVSSPSLQPQTAQKGPCSTPQWDNHAWHFTSFHFSLTIWSSFSPAFSVNTAFCCSEELELALLFRRQSWWGMAGLC